MQLPADMPSIGCEIVLNITPARRMGIADRLDPALPPGWEVVSEFHRTVDPSTSAETYDSYFHTVRTHTDRVPVTTLLEFGDKFAEIDEQLNIERAREESPEVWEDAIESLGRQRALEMFADVGGSGASLVRLGVRVPGELPEGAKPEVLLRAVTAPMSLDSFESLFMTEPFLGRLLQTERPTYNRSTGDTGIFLAGGSLVSNIESVREAVDHLETEARMDRQESAIVCRVKEEETEDKMGTTITGP